MHFLKDQYLSFRLIPNLIWYNEFENSAVMSMFAWNCPQIESPIEPRCQSDSNMKTGSFDDFL